MTALTLFNIAEQYRADLEKLAAADLDEQTLRDTLESLGGDLEVKATSVAALALHLDVLAAGMKEAEANMKRRRESLENRVKGMYAYLLACMQHAGVQRIESPEFTLAIKANPPAVEVFEPGLVPAEFFKQAPPPPPAIDKVAIKAAIKAGTEVPGCRLVAGVRLDIA